MLKVDRSNYAPQNPYTDAPQPLGHQVGTNVLQCCYWMLLTQVLGIRKPITNLRKRDKTTSLGMLGYSKGDSATKCHVVPLFWI